MGRVEALRRSFLAMAILSVCAACGGSSALRADPNLAMPTVQEYQLGPGDRLRISVYGETELTGEFVVGTTGVVSYPLIGDHPAEGKTVAEFTETLRTALQRYVLRPSMSVEVLNYRPFFILGEVQSPGTYPYAGGLNVMNAVATAGGFSYRADTRRVFIKHANEIAEREYPLTSTTPVLPGDTVRVAERRF